MVADSQPSQDAADEPLDIENQDEALEAIRRMVEWATEPTDLRQTCARWLVISRVLGGAETAKRFTFDDIALQLAMDKHWVHSVEARFKEYFGISRRPVAHATDQCRGRNLSEWLTRFHRWNGRLEASEVDQHRTFYQKRLNRVRLLINKVYPKS